MKDEERIVEREIERRARIERITERREKDGER